MPFRSAAQAKFLWARHPTIAKRWTKKYGGWEGLPEHVKRKAIKSRLQRRQSRNQVRRVPSA